MPDRHGAPLNAGDSALYFHDADTVQSVTVLRVLPNDRYVIQLDPRDPMAPPTPSTGLVDVQEPFEVSGAELVFFGWELSDD